MRIRRGGDGYKGCPIWSQSRPASTGWYRHTGGYPAVVSEPWNSTTGARAAFSPLRYHLMNTVFFSWQSDHNETKTFVTRALEDAIATFNQRAEPEDHLRLDEDTRDVPGWPDIANVLFEKIQSCAVFVADITPINDALTERQAVPNPNVMLELGYALGAGHKEQRIVTVVNRQHLPDRKYESLPFDIRGRVHVGFDADCAAIPTPDHGTLSEKLLGQIEHIVASLKGQPQDSAIQNLKETLLDGDADLDILTLMSQEAEQQGDIDYTFHSDELTSLVTRCGIPSKVVASTVAQLAYRGLIRQRNNYRDLGTCQIAGRGVLLAGICADMEKTQAQYAAIAKHISDQPQPDQIGMAINDIAEESQLSYFFVQAVLDVWEDSSLLRVQRTLGSPPKGVAGFIEQVRPLLAREAAPDAAAKILLEPYENRANDPLTDSSALSRALSMRDDWGRPGFIPGFDSGAGIRHSRPYA